MYDLVIYKIKIDNPDLTYDFIKQCLIATAQIKSGDTTPYKRRK